MKSIYILTILAVLSIGLVYQNSYAVEWVDYTSEKYGLSLQVPSNWDIVEKQNRLTQTNSPELTVTNPENKINRLTFQDLSYMNPQFDLLGLETMTVMMSNSFIKGGSTLIENVDMDQYEIDGQETGTFLTVKNIVADRTFMVENDDNGYMIRYQNFAGLFEDPESQEIMNHMIESIKFLD